MGVVVLSNSGAELRREVCYDFACALATGEVEEIEKGEIEEDGLEDLAFDEYLKCVEGCIGFLEGLKSR